jgi:hypothetical protein
MSAALSTGETVRGTTRIGSWVGPRTGLFTVEKKNKLLFVSAVGSQFSGQARSLVTEPSYSVPIQRFLPEIPTYVA